LLAFQKLILLIRSHKLKRILIINVIDNILNIYTSLNHE